MSWARIWMAVAVILVIAYFWFAVLPVVIQIFQGGDPR